MLTLARVAAALLLGTSLVVTENASAGVPLLGCDPLPGLTLNVWQGSGVTPGAGDQWNDDDNWSLGIAPVRLEDPYVCIPAGGLPVIRAGEEAQLVALDVATDGVLEVDPGGELFLYGPQLTPSTIRGRLEVSGAALGGTARVDVLGTLVLRTLDPAAPTTITTRECAYFPGPYRLGEEPCVPGIPIVGEKGQIVVGDEGVVDVSGGKVILGDQYQLRTHGLVRIHDNGLLAADHGTRLELLSPTVLSPGTGTLRFEDDGDYLEGNNFFGIAELGTVVNQGRVVKTGGAGTSIVTGAYSQPAPGAVTANSGTLLLPSGSPTAAAVGSGAAFGSGRCLIPGQSGCEPQTFDVDRQNVQLRVPTADSSGASVLVQELTATSSAADIGFPVEAHADGLSATPADPAILSLRYDERLLGGRDWTSVNVFRRADGSATYAELQPCLANGRPGPGQVACVDRRGLAESSRNVFDADGPGEAPDVVMVIRTTGTSRWVAR
jgi:hypothetical protein